MGADSKLPDPDLTVFLQIKLDLASSRDGYGDEIYDVSSFQEKVACGYSKLISHGNWPCITFPDIDWSERKTEVTLKHDNATVQPSSFSEDVFGGASYCEWDLPWLTGYLDDFDGIHTLSLDFVKEQKKELSPTINADPSPSLPLENDVTKPHVGAFEELYYPEIDAVVEGVLANASSPSSIERLEYHRKTTMISSSSYTQFGAPKNTWAIPVSLTDPVEPIANPILTFPFELDSFQKQSIYHLEQGHSIFVAAHTSAGKTVVAEYAASLALSKLSRAIYTSPIKALSNQKYREFSRRFCGKAKKNSTCKDASLQDGITEDLENMDLDPGLARDVEASLAYSSSFRQRNLETSVGLLTGDIQVNPHASLLVITTEILRSMLYKNSPLLSDLSCVIFDEVHYMNDSERGVVWEETLILLPPTVQLVLLSATLPNVIELADWLGRTRGQPIWVITTPHRPVPLEHYLLHVPVATGSTYKPILLSAPENQKPFFSINPAASARKACNPTQKAPSKVPSKNNPTAGGGIKRNPSGGSRGYFSPHHIKGVLNFIQRCALLPAILFVFSRKRCEEAIDLLSKMNITLLSKGEQYFVNKFLNQRVLSLLSTKEDEKTLPQVIGTISVLKMGIATHHSGLLPVLKEAIEILFSFGIIKLLVATETFAMGINMPARCVIFGELQKPDGTTGSKGRRLLTPGEYTQMAGRAGRRGLDERGLVFVCHEQQDGGCEDGFKLKCKQLIDGKGQPLQSQFRLTYNTILQLIRRPNIQNYSNQSSENGVANVSDLIRKSFFENATQRSLPTQAASLRQLELELEDICIPICPYGCDEEMMQNIRERVSRARESVSTASFVPGRRVASISEATEFLQPGLILADVGASRSATFPGAIGPGKLSEKAPAKNAANSFLVQVLFFPIAKGNPWRGQLERPIDAGRPSSISIQAVPANELIPVGGNKLIPIENYSSNMKFDSSAYQGLLDAVLAFHLEENGPDFSRASDDQGFLNFGQAFGGSHALPQCPAFSEHWATFHRIHECRHKIDALKWSLSAESLSLLPEYESRLRVLELCGFIQDHAIITLKGRIACEIQTADELLVTELLVGRMWGPTMPAADIVALLSVFVFQEKTSEDYDVHTVPEHLLSHVQEMRAVANRLGSIQREAGLPLSASISNYEKINTGLVAVIHAWASGKPFSEICKMTSTQEGIIVRTVLRLDETCRDIRNAARIMGDSLLQEKMLEASLMIKRDICYLKSLYLD
ncbi:hypothetical protein DI09_23p110 [Mitosporidium daphniae]|uniref:Uncharacterized protein n=1 Tax=Mitosporidium daphniae TaxID=1485682 RepID=A0A098VW41_9MICR|nr:uncharacterized protein DI09_23p110 [Mitosporidium daphniae]KGG51936.1 hypothetical protein DI09_23p110 [Mitosporidium daphniae]|eukprot:XP_013238363.1 uncharacterized protein DI09_23p110 [Mitosporidium daphniae]